MNKNQKYIHILHINQTNFWAVVAWAIRLGAYIFTGNKFKETVAHSALGYYGHDGRMYVIEMRRSGSRIRPFEKVYGDSFKGSVKAHICPFLINVEVIQKIIEINSGKTYSTGAAIKSQFGDFIYENTTKDDFCSESAIEHFEHIAKKDIILGKNSKYSPTELYNYLKNNLKYKLITLK